LKWPDLKACAAVFVLAALCSATAAVGTQAPAARYPLMIVGGSRLMVDAKINGHDAMALLDSAAEATVLDSAFARALNLATGQKVSGQGSGKASFDAELVSGVTLEAVGMKLADQSVAVVDLTDLSKRLIGRTVQVILGREIFDAARLEIDIDAPSIAAVSRDLTPRGVPLTLVTEHGVETVEVRVDGGAPVRATFDLGNGREVLISRGFATRMKLLAEGRSAHMESGGGLGGAVQREIVILRRLEVAGQTFANVRAAVDPQPSASDVNIGVSILRHFRLTTDFANHTVWLEPRADRT
jgi:hypothetical protein